MHSIVCNYAIHDKHIWAWLLIIINVVQIINLLLQTVTLLWQYGCIHSFVIVQYVSDDKYICVSLLIICKVVQRNYKQSVHWGNMLMRIHSFAILLHVSHERHTYLCMVAYHKQCCAKYKSKYRKTVSTWGEYACIRSIVIVQYVSHDKHICVSLLIISNVVQKIYFLIELKLYCKTVHWVTYLHSFLCICAV